jgi:hypothetical protein
MMRKPKTLSHHGFTAVPKGKIHGILLNASVLFSQGRRLKNAKKGA